MKRQVKKGFFGILIAVATMAITLFAGGCKNVNVDEWFCNHKYNDGIVIVDAGCSTDGTLERTCTECGKKKTEPIIAVGHEFDEEVIVVEPTCTTTGLKTYMCACGASKTETIPMKGHEYLYQIAYVRPSCSDEGTQILQCECGEAQTEVIPKTPHDNVILLSTENMMNTYICMSCSEQWTEACMHESFDENDCCEICGAPHSILE